MLNRFAWVTSRFLAHNFGGLSRLLYSLAAIYTRSYKNLNYDMSSNGEFLLLDRLSKTDIKTVFDVGANKGDYTLACLQRFPRATIHAFEIVPETFRKLQSHVQAGGRVILNDFGLSDQQRTLQIDYNPDHDGSSSLVEGGAIHDAAWRKIDVEVRTGDEYCRSNEIQTIDLLKIDVEGAEHLVLDGFKAMLAQERVSCVQFEFGMVNIYSKFLLKDFWAVFEAAGFVVGPIMPDGVEFKPYDPRDEDFQGPPNFFAVQRRHASIIGLLTRSKGRRRLRA